MHVSKSLQQARFRASGWLGDGGDFARRMEEEKEKERGERENLAGHCYNKDTLPHTPQISYVLTIAT